MTRHRSPEVYRCIARITEELARTGISKAHRNLVDEYDYRSIDDVLNALAPLLAKHRLCVLPRVLERTSDICSAVGMTALTKVALSVAFDLVSAKDGSSHTVQTWAEALDEGDKGTSKALSSAFKGAMLQVFCVPVAGADADASSHKISNQDTAEPPQGWEAWSGDIVEIVGSCDSDDALDRLRKRYMGMLTGLKRERPDLYAQIGASFSTRAGKFESSRQCNPSTVAAPAGELVNS